VLYNNHVQLRQFNEKSILEKTSVIIPCVAGEKIYIFPFFHKFQHQMLRK